MSGITLDFVVQAIDNRIATEPNLLADSDNSVRRHLGASIIGKGCHRAAFYSFRWFAKPSFEGRMLRLFQRGHDEEARLVHVLSLYGMSIVTRDPETGKQFRFIGYKGHYGGGLDGIATGVRGLERYGVTEKSRLLTEFKTHNDKSFRNLVSTKSVKRAKPEHYVQMQEYIFEMSLDAGLYCAINKNDDHIYLELVLPDNSEHMRTKSIAEIIVDATSPPPRIPYASPSHFTCQFCDYRGVCFMGVMPLKNCRTCQSSVAIDGGNWYCNKWSAQIPQDAEAHGCDSWRAIL